MTESKKRPLVVEIKYNSLDDGPGIRTAVFFKGCPLRCAWCHNPEALKPEPELAWMEKDCLGCGECSKVCSSGAATGLLKLRHDPEKCVACFSCVDACPAGARKSAGRYYEPEELLRLLLRDKPFYRNSGGGVTLTGGEPMMHMEYASAILKGLREKGVHTVVETSGLFSMHSFEELVLPCVDLIFFDVKLLDGAEHLKYTGLDNAVILRNLEALSEKAGDKVLPRVPLIPAMTATENNLLAIARWLKSLGFKDAALLPYNPLWLDKARSVGRDPSGAGRSFMKRDEIAGLEKIFYGALRG
jgi:pyruvate formate lyase activating enzyme